MAMIRVAPVPVRVRTDWFDGRPREITWGEQRVPVTGVDAVREERAAFPVVVGPRTVFEVQTPLARMTLSFRHRTRRWSIEGVDEAERTAA
jgi:cytochrome oxidase assembly protein ShyY1